MSDMNKAQASNIADECAKRAQALPESTQFAFITALPNICNGAFWGFTHVEECREFAEALKSDSNILLRKLSDGQNVLVEVNPDYLVKAARIISPKLVTDEDARLMQEGMAEGAAMFEKFLISKADKGFNDVVGIYCINDSTAITYKGKTYPAFRIDVRTALNLMAKWGYCIGVQGQWVQPNQAFALGSKLFASMKMSPTNTGVFVQLASTMNTEQLKQAKAQYGIGRKKANPQ